jgi:hypothetical protein
VLDLLRFGVTGVRTESTTQLRWPRPTSLTFVRATADSLPR